MRFTVLGGRGFIGSHVVAGLEARGVQVLVPERGDPGMFERPLGHVVFCAGLAGDARSRPRESVEAHAWLVSELLARADFESLVYVSSTRVYAKAASTREGAPLLVDPADPTDFFGLTKLLGEAACLSSARREACVARVSNVFGRGQERFMFVPSLIEDALTTGRIVLRSPRESQKDYISVEAVAAVLPRLACEGESRLYNVASGVNLTHGQVVDRIRELTGCEVRVEPEPEALSFPVIEVERVRSEFPNFDPGDLMEALPAMVAERRAALGAHARPSGQ